MTLHLVTVRGVWTLAACAFGLALAGCTGGGRTSLFPNPDPELRKTSAQLASDARVRFPFKADAPRGDASEAPARAQVHYGLMEKVELADLSQTEDYRDVEIWLDRQFVLYVPSMNRSELKTLHFKMFYDDKGNFFEPSKDRPVIKQIEMVKDGKVYDVKVALAD